MNRKIIFEEMEKEGDKVREDVKRYVGEMQREVAEALSEGNLKMAEHTQTVA